MIQTNTAYRAAVTGITRMTMLRTMLEIISPDIVYGETETNSETSWSRKGQMTDRVFTRSRYATLERGRWRLDGSWKLLPTAIPEGDKTGYVSRVVSGEDGKFSPQPWVELQFSGVTILQACSVYFSKEPEDGVPEDFTVEIKSGGVTYHTATITGNSAAQLDVREFTVDYPDAIRVTVRKWSKPGRRMRAVEIIPGVFEEWDNSILASFQIKQQANFAGLALPYGTCVLRMDNRNRRFEPRSKNGVFQSIEERQDLDISIGVRLEDGSWHYVPVGKYYQYSAGWKTGDNDTTMEWELVDIVGLLAERQYIVPETLPTTLEGWAASFVAQLGKSFQGLYIVDPEYAGAALSCSAEDVQGKTCGQLMRWAAMASGTWVRADAKTGKLTFEPYWNEGNKLTLDNMETYPTMRANDDLAAIIFTLADGENSQYIVSGNTTASSKTVSVKNPFIHTQEQALTAARMILSTYGGNKLETIGRGDPAGEIGDVDTVWMDESSATTGRRMSQSFIFRDGVMQGCQSTLLQADGAFLWENRKVITQSGTWTPPAGVTQVRYFIVGPGEDGTDGTDGSYAQAGVDGVDGIGGKVLAGVMNLNEGQTVDVSISDTETTFGSLSSINGNVYANGYTDIASGESYGRTGVPLPVDGSGDGGKAGKGGVKGNKHEESIIEDTWLGPLPTLVTVIDNRPGVGTKGSKGALGCVVLYWEGSDV